MVLPEVWSYNSTNMAVHVNWTFAEDLIVKSWAAAGPLVGVLVGALLGRSWDRRKWLNDNRKEEYRELITALTDAATAMMERVESRDGAHIQLVRERSEFVEEKRGRYLKSLKVLQDRLFIAAEIEKMKLFDRWGDAVKKVLDDKNVSAFDDKFEVIKSDIVKRATTL
jgi:hypothetical protein